MPHEQKPSPDPSPTFLTRSLQVVTALLLLLHFVHGVYRSADYDEFQTLVNAVLESRGLNLYADFWDNHGPLMTWLLTPVIEVWSGGHELLMRLRAMMWINTALLVILLVTTVKWLLRDTTLPSRQLAPWTAAIILLSAPAFLAKALEIRPDNPANLCATISLIALMAALRRPNGWLYFLSGLLLGTMAAFTLKALLYAIALASFMAGYLIMGGRRPQPLQFFPFIPGLALAPATVLAVLAHNVTLQPFLQTYLWENIQRPHAGISSSELTRITKNAPLWAASALVILGTALWRTVRRKAIPEEAGLALLILALILQFALLLPTRYYQSLLPVYPALAVLTGLTISRLSLRPILRLHPAWQAIGLIVLLLLLVRDIHDFGNLRDRHLPDQYMFANKIAATTDRDAFIVDPGARVFLRPAKTRYPVLVKHIRNEYRAGRLDPGVTQNLHQADAVVMDSRTLDLPQHDLDYIKTHFDPAIKSRQAEFWRRKSPPTYH